jgi:hypothetical protein
MSVRPNFSQLDELTDILLFNKSLNKGDIGRNMVVLIRNPNCNSYLKNKILDALQDEDINFKSNLFIASLYLYDNDVVDELIKLFYSSLLKEKEKEELKIHFNFLAKRGDLSQSQKESLKVIIGN